MISFSYNNIVYFDRKGYQDHRSLKYFLLLVKSDIISNVHEFIFIFIYY